ncbi:MAG: serine hydrolase [Alphaproteobacteria bacterium]|nr:serine hydrolase [Alphaproteobacteria bacterium]
MLTLAPAPAWRLLIAGIALYATAAARADALVPLPAQSPTVPYPANEWPDVVQPNVEAIVARAFTGQRPPAFIRLKAVVVIHRGSLVAERYATGITRDTRLQSWSMAKSFLHAALGLAIDDHRINPDTRAPVPEWQNANDPRRQITIRQLAQMTDGLDFKEDYGDAKAEAMQMLFGTGRGDTGRAAAEAKLGAQPGTRWSYSSGSANILSRILRDRLGGRDAYRALLFDKLFAPLGIKTAVPEFDASGTWIGSSYVHATARDFARFGLLYLRGGVWEGRQIIPADWVATARTPTAASNGLYGALFWLNATDRATGKPAVTPLLPTDTFFARGFGGQLITIVPSRDAVIVMLSAAYTEDVAPIPKLLGDILNALPPGG